MYQHTGLDPKALGQLIKERRKGVYTSESLAHLLGVDVKTLQKWERGQVTRIHRGHREKLHDVLGIPLQLLNLPDHCTLEGAYNLQEQIPMFLEQGAYVSAKETSDLLIRECTASKNGHREKMQSILVRVYHTKGLATATLTGKPSQALPWFERMERIADELMDRNGWTIALTYQGEMYRRRGLREKSRDCYNRAGLLLTEATSQKQHLAGYVLGNAQQLLARVYLATGETKAAFRTLRLAEEAAIDALSQDMEQWYMPFCLCAVKVELARSQMLVGRYDDAMTTIEEVRRLVPGAAPRWAIPAALTEGELLIRFVRMRPDQTLYEQGKHALLKGYALAHQHHHRHQQQRIRRLITQWSKGDETRLDYTYQLQEGVRHIDEAEDES
jgi:transcriptional regulator with XRE-family HTH domain